MATTQLRKKGCDISRLTDKMARFCLAYLVSMNQTEAARLAYPSNKNPDVLAVKLMKNPKVKAFLGKQVKQVFDKYEIDATEVLVHLHACATRDGKDFVDDKGRLLIVSQNINDLPDNVTMAVNSIKQKERRWVDEDGIEVVELETEVKLVDKGQAMEMCMKHKGLFQEQKVSVKLGIDWDGLYQTDPDAIPVDSVEHRLLEEEGDESAGRS